MIVHLDNVTLLGESNTDFTQTAEPLVFKAHSYYFSRLSKEPIEYSNAHTQTIIKRVSAPTTTSVLAPTTTSVLAPTTTSVSAPTTTSVSYESRDKLLEAEVIRRKEIDLFERGGYDPKKQHVALTVERSDIGAEVKIDKETKKALSLEKNSIPSSIKYFHHSALEGKQYKNSKGIIQTMSNVVSASWDRSTDDLHMARVHLDSEGNSICYASRADTEKRAIKQAKDIFKTEFALGEKGKGIKEMGDNRYKMTYVVNSLTNPLDLSPPGALDEKMSLQKEMRVYSDLKVKEITVRLDDGREVSVQCNPIHVHHTLSVMNELSTLLDDEYSGRTLVEGINALGYDRIKELVSKGSDAAVILKELEKPGKKTHEKLVLTDLLVKELRLPIVHHCKSVVDRTSVAVSVGSVNHTLRSELSVKKVLAILADESKFESYKELFVGFMNVQHQISYDARIGEMPDGSPVGRSKMGLNLKSGLLTAKETLGLFPERMKQENIKGKKCILTLVTLLGVFLYYPALILGVIGRVCQLLLQRKTDKLKKELSYYGKLATLPMHIRYRKIGQIDLSVQWNLNAPDIKSDERNLFVVSEN